MSDEEQDGGDDFMEELQQRELDGIILAEAFSNSYKLLIKELTFEDIIERDTDKEYVAVLTYDPDEGPLLVELENMIDYYIEHEEYERCSKIKEIMNDRYPESKLTE